MYWKIVCCCFQAALTKEPQLRPTAEELLNHPLFFKERRSIRTWASKQSKRRLGTPECHDGRAAFLLSLCKLHVASRRNQVACDDAYFDFCMSRCFLWNPLWFKSIHIVYRGMPRARQGACKGRRSSETAEETQESSCCKTSHCQPSRATAAGRGSTADAVSTRR